MEIINKRKASSRDLTLAGMLVAITVILDYTIGVIPLPMVAITIVHLPAIIAGIVLGPVMGALIGFSMGATSLIHALTRPPSPFSALVFTNPLIAILPRIFIGVLAYYAYTLGSKYFSKSKTNISVFIGAAIGSLTNTIGVLGMIFLLYAQEIELLLEGTTAKAFVISVASTNGVAEAIASGIICTPIVLALKKIYK